MTPTDSSPTTETKCARCDASFERAKNQPGVFRAWLSGYCPACRPKVEEEHRQQEADRISGEQMRQREERERRIIESRTRALGGVVGFEDFMFETYDPDLNNTHEWLNYARKFPIEAKNLYVYGPTGVGKTHLCTAIVRTMWDKVPPGTVRVLKAQDVIERVMFPDGGRANPYQRSRALDELVAIDGLFVDELDKMEVKKTYVEIFQDLIDRRARQRKYGIVFAANIGVGSMAKDTGMPLADRIDDRSFEIFCIPANTPSVRGILKKKSKQEKSH